MTVKRMQQRHDTAAAWASTNPTLLEGEIGYEKGTGLSKWGDGVTPWNSLPYQGGGSSTVRHTEIPSGTKNGSNPTFTVSQPYVSGSMAVYRNGLREIVTVGFDETSSTTITFSTPPLASDDLSIEYTIA